MRKGQQMPTIYTGENVCSQMKAVMSTTVDISSCFRTHDAAHDALLVPAFIDAYLWLRIHYYYKELREVQKVERRSRQAVGQMKRRATLSPAYDISSTSCTKRKLKKLNIIQ